MSKYDYDDVRETIGQKIFIFRDQDSLSILFLQKGLSVKKKREKGPFRPFLPPPFFRDFYFGPVGYRQQSYKTAGGPSSSISSLRIQLGQLSLAISPPPPSRLLPFFPFLRTSYISSFCEDGTGRTKRDSRLSSLRLFFFFLFFSCCPLLKLAARDDLVMALGGEERKGKERGRRRERKKGKEGRKGFPYIQSQKRERAREGGREGGLLPSPFLPPPFLFLLLLLPPS